MRIQCPFCGDRPVSEFAYGGDASRARPSIDNQETETWAHYVYDRKNPPGVHQEYWHHVQGCRSWLVVERDTTDHTIQSTKFAACSEETSS